MEAACAAGNPFHTKTLTAAAAATAMAARTRRCIGRFLSRELAVPESNLVRLTAPVDGRVGKWLDWREAVIGRTG